MLVYLFEGLTRPLFQSLLPPIGHQSVKAHFPKVSCPKNSSVKIKLKGDGIFWQGLQILFSWEIQLCVKIHSTLYNHNTLDRRQVELRFYEDTWDIFLQNIFLNACQFVQGHSKRKKEEMLLSIFMNLKGSVVSGTGSLVLSREQNSKSNHFPHCN